MVLLAAGGVPHYRWVNTTSAPELSTLVQSSRYSFVDTLVGPHDKPSKGKIKGTQRDQTIVGLTVATATL